MARPIVVLFLLAVLTTALAVAQAAPATQGGMQSGDLTQLNNTLTQLQQTAEQANAAIGKLRIEKWKVDGKTKAQAQANADSLQRNLTAALPEMMGRLRNAPQDLTANFRLYRNLNAFYDVFASLAESAGAFGPKDQYEALANQVAAIDSLRHEFADRIEQLASVKEMELARFRTAAERAARQQVAAPPKKIIVDDTEPPKSKKKKPKTAPPK